MDRFLISESFTRSAVDLRQLFLFGIGIVSQPEPPPIPNIPRATSTNKELPAIQRTMDPEMLQSIRFLDSSIHAYSSRDRIVLNALLALVLSS